MWNLSGPPVALPIAPRATGSISSRRTRCRCQASCYMALDSSSPVICRTHSYPWSSTAFRSLDSRCTSERASCPDPQTTPPPPLSRSSSSALRPPRSARSWCSWRRDSRGLSRSRPGSANRQRFKLRRKKPYKKIQMNIFSHSFYCTNWNTFL